MTARLIFIKTHEKGATMTKTLTGSAVIMAGAILGMIGPANAAEITVMGYRTAFEKNYKEVVIEPFMRAHPDIKVNYYPTQNGASAMGILRAQKSAPQVNVVIYDWSVGKIALEEGIAVNLDTSKLSNYPDIAALGKELGGGAIPLTYDSLALVYDRDAYKGKPPTSWEALWDPAQKGKVIVSAQGGGDISTILMTIIANRLAGEDDYKKTLRPAVEKLLKLAPNIQTWEPKPDLHTLVGNGTASISAGYNARAQFYFDQTGGRQMTVEPKEGSVAQVNVISAVANAPELNATMTFINYALAAETQARFARTMFYAPTNTKAVVEDDVRKRIPLMNPEQRARMIPVDWVYVSEKRDRFLEPWRREIIPASR